MVVQAPEFQPARLQAYVENLPPARTYPLAALMPDKKLNDINFAYNVINGTYAPAASITGFNASAPLRDKKAQEKAFGTVAKLHHSYFFDEVELLAYNKPRTPEERQQVIDDGLDETDVLSQGVDDLKEYLRAQAIYNGRVKYDNDAEEIHLDIELDVPEENKITVTTSWTDPGAKPLSDIQSAVKQFKKTNQRRKPQVMHMTSATEALLLQSEQIRVQVYGDSNGGRLLTPGDVQNAFAALRLPPYEINDDVIVIDGEEVQLLDDNKVVLIGEKLGFTAIGPAAERGYTPGRFGYTIEKQNPPSEQIIVGELAFPALQRTNAIVTLSV